MEKDLILKKYKEEGFGKNAFGWYFNPWIDEYDENYDPHNDKYYNKNIDKEKLEWHPKLTQDQIEELIAEGINPGDEEYDIYLWNHDINPFEENTAVSPNKIKENTTDKKVDLNSIKNNSIEAKSVYKVYINLFADEVEYIVKVPNNNEETRSIITRLRYTDKSILDNVKVLERYKPELEWSKVKDVIDPNIVRAIANGTHESKDDEQFTAYFNTILGKSNNLKIVYNLKDIYNSDLDYISIQNLMNITNELSRTCKENVKVEKDPLYKRIFGNIKKRIEHSKTKLLSQFNTTKEKTKSTNNKEQEVKDNEVIHTTKKDFVEKATISFSNITNDYGTGVDLDQINRVVNIIQKEEQEK